MAFVVLTLYTARERELLLLLRKKSSKNDAARAALNLTR
jgi:hypothetical protein